MQMCQGGHFCELPGTALQTECQLFMPYCDARQLVANVYARVDINFPVHGVVVAEVQQHVGA